MKYSAKKITTTRGFTLIELLIVIAIIGVLAATVVVSLGDQTGTAKKETTKIGVSSVRSLATAEAASPKDGMDLTGIDLCTNIHKHVSAKDKSDWTWKGSVGQTAATCKRLSLTDATGFDGEEGEICCHSAGEEWIVWGALVDSDGYGTRNTNRVADNSGAGSDGNDVYCADSSGFLGEVDILPVAVTGKASIKNNATAGDLAVLKCSD